MYIATVQIVFKRLQSLEYEPNNMAPRMLSYFCYSLKLNWHNSTLLNLTRKMFQLQIYAHERIQMLIFAQYRRP